MNKIKLKKNEDRRIRKGHLWIFSNEIENTSGNAENGDLVEVYDSANNLLGLGFYNRNSLIAVRIISLSREEDLFDLFSVRIKSAFELRKVFYPERESFRLVFSESDFLPGLIIDKYNHTFVLQVNSFGMQRNIDLMIDILKKEYKAKNIFTKNDFHLRKLEGLPEEDTVYIGQLTSEIINDGSVKYQIDFSKSQKTGFYFDQNDNRYFIEKIAKDKLVADVFCNSGGFGLHALKAGAKHVDFVDSSSSEIDNVKENLLLNSLEPNQKYFNNDAFDFFNEVIIAKSKYDVVMIDPPAFAKNKKSLAAAEKGYEKLNKLALLCVNENGFLVTSSCSYHLKKENFLSVINRAASKSLKSLQLIHFNGASFDHPEHASMEETGYLKFAVFKVFHA